MKTTYDLSLPDMNLVQNYPDILKTRTLEDESSLVNIFKIIFPGYSFSYNRFLQHAIQNGLKLNSFPANVAESLKLFCVSSWIEISAQGISLML